MIEQWQVPHMLIDNHPDEPGKVYY
jgi:hypothetical protein